MGYHKLFKVNRSNISLLVLVDSSYPVPISGVTNMYLSTLPSRGMCARPRIGEIYSGVWGMKTCSPKGIMDFQSAAGG